MLTIGGGLVIRGSARTGAAGRQLSVVTPDEFLLRLLEVDVEAVLAVVGEQASGLRHPPMTTEEVLDGLAQAD